MKHFNVGSATLADWLRGIEPPEWTRRPNAKDDLRAEAIELRKQGWSVNDLAVRLGVAKSTAHLWVKHIPLDPNSERAREKQPGRRLDRLTFINSDPRRPTGRTITAA